MCSISLGVLPDPSVGRFGWFSIEAPSLSIDISEMSEGVSKHLTVSLDSLLGSSLGCAKKKFGNLLCTLPHVALLLDPDRLLMLLHLLSLLDVLAVPESLSSVFFVLVVKETTLLYCLVCTIQ